MQCSRRFVAARAPETDDDLGKFIISPEYRNQQNNGNRIRVFVINSETLNQERT